MNPNNETTGDRIAALEALLAKATPLPWGYCGHTREDKVPCCCSQVWCADYPVAVITHGPWGDTYATMRQIPETGSIEGKFEAYTAMIEYGKVEPALAAANVRLIADGVNALPELLADLKQMENLKGVIAADDERLLKACERVGIGTMGCDTADHLADMILGLRVDLKRYREALERIAKPNLNNGEDGHAEEIAREALNAR
jgi:hypothetical protein